jgi:hypothetical protein
MFIESDMRERHGRVLAELAEVGMVMVRRLGEAMLKVADIQVQAQIGLAFHRVSRAVRQTMALEFRLAQAAHRDAVAVQPPSPARASASAPPRPTAERVGWNEYERADSDEPLDALDELLEAEDLDAEAVHEAVETTMARLRRDLAADTLLVKAGVLGPDDPGSALIEVKRPASTPPPRNRRSELLGAASFARPTPVVPPRSAARAGPLLWRSSG